MPIGIVDLNFSCICCIIIVQRIGDLTRRIERQLAGRGNVGDSVRVIKGKSATRFEISPLDHGILTGSGGRNGAPIVD